VISASRPCWPENRGASPGKTTKPPAAATSSQTAATAAGPDRRAPTTHTTTSQDRVPRGDFMAKTFPSYDLVCTSRSDAQRDAHQRPGGSSAKRRCWTGASASLPTMSTSPCWALRFAHCPSSSDDLIGAQQNRLWDLQLQRPRLSQVDEQIKLDWLYDRQIRGSCTLDDSVDV